MSPATSPTERDLTGGALRALFLRNRDHGGGVRAKFGLSSWYSKLFTLSLKRSEAPETEYGGER